MGRASAGTGGQIPRLRCGVLALLCAGVTLALAACGSSSTEAHPSALAPPDPPSAKICGIGSSAEAPAGGARDGEKQSPPPAGIYSYRTRGRSGVPSEALRARDLPRVTTLIVTRSRRFGGLACFRMQKRYSPRLANTETYVIRGDELFLVGLRIEALENAQEVRPVPAVLFASRSGSKWSGGFSGRTSGSYVVTGLGKRPFRLGSKRLKVTGLRSSVSYRGAVTGTQTTTAWISLARRVIVSERVVLRERLGVSEVRLRLRRRLMDLAPDPLASP